MWVGDVVVVVGVPGSGCALEWIGLLLQRTRTVSVRVL